jgi:DNA-binding IclR family transcriptional regulator
MGPGLGVLSQVDDNSPSGKACTMKSVEKVFSVLELTCENGEMKLSEISRQTGLKIGTLHGLLATLVKMGYLRQQAGSKAYGPTMKIFQMGLKARDRTSLVALARPHMIELRQLTGHTVNLNILIGSQTLVMERIEGDNNLTIINPTRTLPAYATSCGKVMLAALDGKGLDEYLATTELMPLTNQTITSKGKLIAELEKIRRLGYALENRELIEGGMCLGVPVRDFTKNVVAAISLSTSYPAVDREKLMSLKGPLFETGRRISAELGYMEE